MTGPLAGIRVVEYGQGVAAPYAGKMLADYGADVLKVEPPGGDWQRRRPPFAGDEPGPERSGSFFYFNTNKRSVVLDLARPGDAAEFRRVVGEVDVLVEDTPADWLANHGLSPESLLAENPNLILTSVTPFGRTGPNRAHLGEDLVVAHGSALAYASRPRGFATYDAEIEPLRPAGNQATLFGGMSAAVATLAALNGRRRWGHGLTLDISIQEAAITAQGVAVAQLSYQGHVVGRSAVPVSAPIALVKCRDGWVWLQCSEEKHWRDFVGLMGSPDWAELEIFKDRFTRGEHWDALLPLILEWTLEHDKEEIFRRAQALRVPHAPAYTFPELLQNTQLNAREFFQTIEHPVLGQVTIPSTPARFSRTPWQPGRAPLLGEGPGAMGHGPGVGGRRPGTGGQGSGENRVSDVLGKSVDWADRPDRTDDSRRPAPDPWSPTPDPRPLAPGPLPLAGLRIIDFSWVHAGPLCGMILAELGAEVIKVETNKRWDIVRRLPPMADRQFGINRSGYFNSVNRGKRSCTLDLAKPEAIALAKDLIRTADVVLENYSAGVMDRLGLGYAALREVRPDIIMVSISGYGATGPDSHYVAYGPPLTAFSGLVQANGYPGGNPEPMGAAWPDPVAAMTSAFCILAAVQHRSRTGEGQRVDISQAEATIAFLGDLITETTLNGRQPARRGNGGEGIGAFGCFRCAGDDAWLAIAATDEPAWHGLTTVIPTLAADARFATEAERWEHRTALREAISDWTRSQTPVEAAATLQAHGVPAAASFNFNDLFADPHLAARDYFVQDHHPETGPRTMIGMPWRLDEWPRTHAAPAPQLGEGNGYAFNELLGLASDETARLEGQQIIH